MQLHSYLLLSGPDLTALCEPELSEPGLPVIQQHQWNSLGSFPRLFSDSRPCRVGAGKEVGGGEELPLLRKGSS